MATNAMIAMGIRPIELNDPLAQYAKVAQIQGMRDQNALAKYQMSKAERDDATANALNQAWSKYDGNSDAVINALREGGNGAAIPGAMKQLQEAENAKTTSQKARVDLFNSKLDQSRRLLVNVATPEDLWQHELADLRDPVIGADLTQRIQSMTKPDGSPMTVPEYMEQKRQSIMQAGQNPQAFAELLNQKKLGYEKFMEMNKPVAINQDLGNGGRVLTRPGLGGAATVVPGSEFTKQMSPEDLARLDIQRQQNAIQQDRNNIMRDKVESKILDPEAELDMTRRKELAKVQGRTEGKNAGTATASAKSAQDSMGVLDEIDRVDPKTGKSLLNTATASGVGSLMDNIGNFIGASSEGAESAAALRVIEGKLLAIAPKLGGSTSNADLKFYKQAAADIGDSRIPAAQKAKALEVIRSIKMKEMGGSGTKPAAANRKPLSDILGE
jgi:hypothetical protein